MNRGRQLSAILYFGLVISIALVASAKPAELKDDPNSASVRLYSSSISSSSAKSPSLLQSALLDSLITQYENQEVLIRKRRRMGAGRGRSRCHGRYDLTGCRRRTPWLPKYLIGRKELNDPGMYGYRTRNRNNQGGYAYVPKRDDASDLVNVRPTFKPIMHIENPKPISHPKKSKGSIRKTVTT